MVLFFCAGEVFGLMKPQKITQGITKNNLSLFTAPKCLFNVHNCRICSLNLNSAAFNLIRGRDKKLFVIAFCFAF